jgi:WD40 repeat protein
MSVAFSNDGAQSGEEAKRLEGHNEWVRSVAFSSDGAQIVSGSDDNTVGVGCVGTPTPGHVTM